MSRRDEVLQHHGCACVRCYRPDARTRRYLISMAIRTVCFIAAILVDGWLTWVLFAGAVILFLHRRRRSEHHRSPSRTGRDYRRSS